jgi:hypothetical protein
MAALLMGLNISPLLLYGLSLWFYGRERSGLSRGRQTMYLGALVGVGVAVVVMAAVIGHGLTVANSLLPPADVLRRWAYPFIAALVLALLSCGLALAGRGWSRILLAVCALTVAALWYEFALAMSP